MRRFALLSAVPLLLVAGCGDDADPAGDAAERPSASSSPSTGAVPEALTETPAFLVATIGSEVVEIDARSGDKRVLSTATQGARPTLVTLSPDRSTVYFVREHGGFAGCDRMEIVAVPRAGGDERVVADVKGYVGSIAVGAERLAYFNSPGCDAGGQVVVRTISGGGERVVDTSKGPGTVTALAFSPDGKRLALGGVESTIVIDPDTAKSGVDGVTLAAPAGQSLVAPQFRSDGSLVVAQRTASVNATPYTALLPVDPASGQPVGEPTPLPEAVDDYDIDQSGSSVLVLDFPADPQGDYPGARLSHAAGTTAHPLVEGVFDTDW